MTGRELKVQRVTLDLKQIELAVRTGIPRERLSRFENSWQSLHPVELERIREVLDQIRAGRHPEASLPVADAQPPLHAGEKHR